MATKIYSYNNGESSRLLAEALGVRRLKHRDSRWRPRRGDILINWGIGITLLNCLNLNLPGNVRNVSNKRRFFELYQPDAGFEVPPYFFERQAALAWLTEDRGRTLVARTLVDSHEGRGIVMIETPEDMVDAPLYTGYVKKKAEYRIHIMAGEVIDEVQKKRRLDHTEGDSRIRNTANGFVFARTDVVVPQCVRDAAIAAVGFYGLNFGAVDIGYNEHYNTAFVFEINTAPGIEGTTVQRYADGFRRHFGA